MHGIICCRLVLAMNGPLLTLRIQKQLQIPERV